MCLWSDIKRYTYSGGWDVRWDTGKGGVPGLGVRVYASGRRAYVFSYRAKGRKRLMVLGDCGDMTLDQARRREDQIQCGERQRQAVADGEGGDNANQRKPGSAQQ